MKRIIQILFIIISFLQHVSGQIIFKDPLSERNSNYQIKVTLDTDRKQIRGREIITWRNISKDQIRELQFHLYMNAFRNNRSTFMIETSRKADKLEKNNGWGWIKVDSLKINGDKDYTSEIEFIQPDDDNREDKTVMRVKLDRPLRSGREIKIEIYFTTQLPNLFCRNGFYKNYFFAAQWFPKMGVYIDHKWNCHQYHANSEFFADYGVYEVDITVPQEYKIGATGILLGEKKSGNLKTCSFRAEDVHDFAWTAWPDYKIAKEKYKNIEIALYYDEDHESLVHRTITAVKNAIEYMTNWVGEYPYPKITIIQPPTKCMNIGGMEYPTFITAGAFYGEPEGIKITELVTIHEFTHNYWYGMVGNNEFEEAWLDEGINTYTEIKIMDKYYGEHTSFLDFAGMKIGEIAFNRSGYISIPDWDRICRDSWTYIGGGYSTFSYSKPALMLLTLEKMVGIDTMNTIMRTYFQRWKFKHPHTIDFIETVNEITGKDYNWFFDQILKESFEIDYRIKSVYSSKEKVRKGYFNRNGKKILFPEKGKKKDEDVYHSVVKVNRKGEAVFPVEILMVFSDGDSVVKKWDGKERWVKYEFKRSAELISAQVDPAGKILLDSNFTNNSKTVKSNLKPGFGISVKVLFWFESILYLFGLAG